MPHFYAVAFAVTIYKFFGFIFSEARKLFCSNNDAALPNQSSGNVVAGLNLKVDLNKRNHKNCNKINLSNPYRNINTLDDRTKRLYALWLGIKPEEFDDYFRGDDIGIIYVKKN